MNLGKRSGYMVTPGISTQAMLPASYATAQSGATFRKGVMTINKKNGEDLWFLQLDFDWMHDKKIVRLKAKYGKPILVDAINTFILMAKCDGIADMNDPAHIDWALQYVGKSGKALWSTFDKLAEFELINEELWTACKHVTSKRACEDVEKRKALAEANRKRTEKARDARRQKRDREKAVTDTVTESVTGTMTET